MDLPNPLPPSSTADKSGQSAPPTPDSPLPYRPPILRSGQSETVHHAPSSVKREPEYSPYGNTQQRRTDFAKREVEQKFSFVFLAPDESLSDSIESSTAAETGAPAPATPLYNPDFVDAACATLLALEAKLPRLASVLGVGGAQHAHDPGAQREALINAYLRAMQHHLPALLEQLAQRRTTALASTGSTGLTSAASSASSTSLPSSANWTSTPSPDVATQPSTPPTSSWKTPGKTPATWGPEQAFLSRVQRQVPEILTGKFGPMLRDLKAVLDKSSNRTRHGEAACKNALTVFTQMSQHLQQASRHAAEGQSVNCRESLRKALGAIHEFRQEHLPLTIRLFPGGDSPIPGPAERAFKEQLRDVASWIDTLLDEPASAIRDLGRERTSSSPASPQKPKPAIAQAPGSPSAPENPLSAARIRFFSANARTPRKLAREAANATRGDGSPSLRSPAPQTTALPQSSRSVSTSATPGSSPAQHASSAALAPPSPRGARRENEKS